MIPSLMILRLQQLETNITNILQLLNEYEDELIDENEPSIKRKYRRRIEELNYKKKTYESEFIELQNKLGVAQQSQVQNISNQLQKIDEKIDLLLDNQAFLEQALLSHFTAREQILLQPFTEQLDESQLIQMQAVLEGVETNEISELEMKQILSETRQLLRALQERNVALPKTNDAISTILNEPTINAKHGLKVSIPIIPFILSYEAELGLEAGLKLKEAWEGWINKFSKK